MIDQTYNPYKLEYDPESGFYGQLNTEVKEFECKAYYDGMTDTQKYELNRKTHNSKISITAGSHDLDLVPVGQNLYNLLVAKNQRFNLTCNASVGCNDIKYDIHFLTNLTVSSSTLN